MISSARFQLTRRRVLQQTTHEIHAIDDSRRIAAAAAGSQLAAKGGNVAFGLAVILNEPRHTFGKLLRRDFQHIGRLHKRLLTAAKPFKRAALGDRLDPADAASHSGFGHDPKKADVPGPPDMRAAT